MCAPTTCAAASIPSRHTADATPKLRHEVPCPIRRVLTEVDIDLTVVHIVMIRIMPFSNYPALVAGLVGRHRVATGAGRAATPDHRIRSGLQLAPAPQHSSEAEHIPARGKIRHTFRKPRRRAASHPVSNPSVRQWRCGGGKLPQNPIASRSRRRTGPPTATRPLRLRHQFV